MFIHFLHALRDGQARHHSEITRHIANVMEIEAI